MRAEAIHSDSISEWETTSPLCGAGRGLGAVIEIAGLAYVLALPAFFADKGWLRVRAYLDNQVTGEPAGEIWLGKTEARYATPDDLDQGNLIYGRPET